MQLGIIGFGNFGQFLASLLKGRFEVFVASRTDKSKIAKRMGVKFVSPEEAASKDVVVFCVPLDSLERALDSSRGFLKDGSIVMDTCSVKERPAQLMKDTLPKNVDIVSTHPLFGPNSGKNGIEGLGVVLCPVRAAKKSLAAAKDIFSRLGLNVIVMTPEEHDKRMARTQALAHFIGLALNKLGIENGGVTTPSFEKLLEMEDIIREDMEQLSGDIMRYNKYAKSTRDKFIKELEKINKE